MAFQNCPNIVKVAVDAQLQGEACINTLHFLKTGEVSSGDTTSLAAAVLSIWEAEMIPILPDVYELFGCDAVDLTVAGSWGSFVPVDGEVLGELSGTPSPNNVSLAVSFRTGRRGRSYYGRNFWPAFINTTVDNNRVDLVARLAIVGAYNHFVGANSVLDDFIWVVLSRENAGAVRPEGIGTPITVVSIVDDVVDSMSRRLPKRGQ